MAKSLSKVYVHLVFSTKNRLPLIKQELLPEMWAVAGSILSKIGCQPVSIGGTTNHLHVLFILGREESISGIARVLKSSSSKWYSEKTHNPFVWQTGYAIFSVSPTNVEPVRHYIQHQEEHHRKYSFEDEMRKFYEKCDEPLDEKYMWG